MLVIICKRIRTFKFSVVNSAEYYSAVHQAQQKRCLFRRILFGIPPNKSVVRYAEYYSAKLILSYRDRETPISRSCGQVLSASMLHRLYRNLMPQDNWETQSNCHPPHKAQGAPHNFCPLRTQETSQQEFHCKVNKDFSALMLIIVNINVKFLHKSI